MDVVFISNYWHFPSEKSSSRYHSLATMAVDEGLSVEVVTSRFYHTRKQYRDYPLVAVPYKVTLLEEGMYRRNVSISRIFAHMHFADCVIGYLECRKKPDVIYLFVPPVGLAKKVTDFAKRNRIRIIIDILDLWPEAFEMVLPSAVSGVALYPVKKSIDYVYENADSVIAVSQTYVNRAIEGNKKKCGHAVFIGTDISNFDVVSHNACPLENKLRPITMAYIGMLGHSYDICGVMDAMRLLIDQGIDNTELLVMGDGPLEQKFIEYAKNRTLPVRFLGRLSYEEMVQKLVCCDIGVNVLVGKAAQSIINKHADYAAAGIPIINVQKNQEFGSLLQEYNAGITCVPGDVQALANAIKCLSEDREMRIRMGRNCRRLAVEKFDRKSTYIEIMDVIKGDVQ